MNFIRSAVIADFPYYMRAVFEVINIKYVQRGENSGDKELRSMRARVVDSLSKCY